MLDILRVSFMKSEPASFPLARAIDLVSLVDYAPGAVVSRTIVKKDTGTITIFAFDTNEGLSEHTAPYDALVQVVDGQAKVTIGQRRNYRWRWPDRANAGQRAARTPGDRPVQDAFDYDQKLVDFRVFWRIPVLTLLVSKKFCTLCFLPKEAGKK